MNTYHLMYFGLLATRRGTDEESFRSTAGTTTALADALNAQYQLGISRDAMLVAVNDVLVPWTHPLHDGDRVALLPPMSGG